LLDPLQSPCLFTGAEQMPAAVGHAAELKSPASAH
jgi:hypothetical protein